MKILIHSNGPHVSTGYGVQTGLLAERLKAAGHDVAISCTYGQQGNVGEWRGIKLYPGGYETNGNDVIHNHALHHFDGDPKGGWIITLLDVWCMVNPRLADFNVLAWVPVDHFPAPPDVLKFFQRSNALPVAMSRFGERLLFEAGLAPTFIPLSVDTKAFKPTPTVQIGDKEVSGRQFIGVPEDAFVVGMVAMNKGWARDRKGFNEAFRAFGQFWQTHQDAVLYCHSDWPGGAEGINLKELALHASIPEHALVFVDQYAYRFGFKPEQMAAVYTAFDVLLAPSHGEGFGVPLIEAQACGTPVITTDFSAQTELTGVGVKVPGQGEWDPAQHASYVVPFIGDIIRALEAAYELRCSEDLQAKAVAFASGYDSDRVFESLWVPFLEQLDNPPGPVPLEREPMPDENAVAVIVPFCRPENLSRLLSSFDATNDGTASIVLVTDVPVVDGAPHVVSTDRDHTTYAEKVNIGVRNTTEPWVLIVGDDCEFKPGWLDAARKLSDRFDVIGTNDTSGAVKNPDVAAGRHADHFFVRRAYIDTYGACLDGPGTLAPEAYRHWYCDKEVIELAKARRVFTPCLDSIIEHHHPGYEGREDLREADPVYMTAVESAEADAKTFRQRLPLIHMAAS